MDNPDTNVAFKCTYNDGGVETGFIGFGGTCSNQNILRNVKNGRIWCSDTKNKCRAFLEKNFQGKRPSRPCYESQIVDKWRFSPGEHHSGKKIGRPISMNNARAGKVVLLTTRHPQHDKERDRIVFAVYKILNVRHLKNGMLWLESDVDHSIRLSESASFALPYWTFINYPASGKPDWRTGLFRYVSDQEVANFLHALEPLLLNAEDRLVLDSLLDCCGYLESTVDVAHITDRGTLTADSKLKHGPKGEGRRHLRLKEYVAQNPEVLNLGSGKTFPEHRFRTGDRVDVSIDLDSGEYCVVEIEVEGETSTMIGAHQALKYRALRAAELDETKLPHTFLVAYSIPTSVKDFCKRHGIKCLEVQPDS